MNGSNVGTLLMISEQRKSYVSPRLAHHRKVSPVQNPRRSKEQIKKQLKSLPEKIDPSCSMDEEEGEYDDNPEANEGGVHHMGHKRSLTQRVSTFFRR